MSDRVTRYSVISLGVVLVLVGLLVVPLSPAMVHPLYWRLADFVAAEPLADLERKDVSAEACPMVTEQSVASVADRRNGVWAFAAPTSLFTRCTYHRVRYLTFEFDGAGQCTAEASISPTCDL